MLKSLSLEDYTSWVDSRRPEVSKGSHMEVQIPILRRVMELLKVDFTIQLLDLLDEFVDTGGYYRRTINEAMLEIIFQVFEKDKTLIASDIFNQAFDELYKNE